MIEYDSGIETYTGKPPRVWLFNACKRDDHNNCSRAFYPHGKPNCYCTCYCHSADYADQERVNDMR